MRQSRPTVTILLIAVYWTLWGGLSASDVFAQAQAQEQEAAPPAIKMDIDLISLLKSERVFAGTADGALWKISPNAGRQLVQIPLIIEPGSEPIEIGSSTIKLTSGRLIAYLLDDFGESNDLLELAKRDAREVNRGARRLAREDEARRDPKFVQPQVAKKFTIQPNGKVVYKMERVVRGAELSNSTSLFAMKINRALLYDKRPERPKNRTDRNALAEFSIANREFLELQKTVNKLPTELECKLPTRIWAVFEIPSTKRDYRFTGESPLPWAIEKEMLLSLRELAKQEVKAEEGFNGEPRLEPSVKLAIVEMSNFSQDPHPYSQRLVAHTLALSRLVRYTQFGDPQFYLLQHLIKGDDDKARRVVMGQLARVIPPTRASGELLKLVAVQAVNSGGEQVKALESLAVAALQGNSATAAQDMVGPANNMLMDENGAAVSEVLEQFVVAARKRPDYLPVFAKNIRFHSLPPNRKSEALIYIVENAGAEPLAAAWLDEQFLSSANKHTLSQALQVIANADTGARDLGPAVNWAIEKLFGPPRASDGGQIERKARMRLPIPILSSRHGIYRSLQHGDRKLRALAWRALPRFTLPILVDETGQPLVGDDERYRHLLDAALDQIPTPTEAVNFFSRQPDLANATRCMVQIVLRGSRDASVASVRALVGGQGPLGGVLDELGPGERQGFAMLTYQIITRRSQPPLVANILRRRDSINPVATWFGDQVAKGQLPAPSEWASQFAGDAPLLELVMSRDTELAKGAAAVLVASVGGGDKLAQTFLETLQSLPDQREETILKAWQEQKAMIRATQLARHEGHYQMILQLFDSPAGTEDAKPIKEIVIGAMQLQVNVPDRQVRFAGQAMELNIPDESETIRIQKPAEIKALPNDELAALPLEKVVDPIYLRRTESGAWEGPLQLEGATRTLLLLKPVTQEAKAEDTKK